MHLLTKDPKTVCTSPITTIDRDGVETTFACRSCDDCISTRKNEWVARGVAEMETAQHSYVLNLTYRNNSDGTKPIAAKAFRYKDVQIFLKRIRNAAKKKYGDGVELRYIVCGERGSQKDRVHWHMILYSSHDLYCLGKWYDFFFTLIGKPRPKRMDHWTFWDHGHIQTDEVDQKAISYVLKYCIKDQFNVVKAKGTARYSKAENDGSGMFRMSKAPPIGWRFVEQKLERLREMEQVPTSVQIAIPRYSGYWWPNGTIRKWYLETLAEINEARRAKTGSDCAGWKALVASVSENEKDKEYLNVNLQETEETFEEVKDRIRTKQSIATKSYAHAKNRKKCGSFDACQTCINSLNETEKREYEAWQHFLQQQYCGDAQARFARENRPNPFCAFQETAEKSHTIGNRLG